MEGNVLVDLTVACALVGGEKKKQIRSAKDRRLLVKKNT